MGHAHRIAVETRSPLSRLDALRTGPRCRWGDGGHARPPRDATTREPLSPQLLEVISTATVDPFTLYRVEPDGALRHEWVDQRCTDGTPYTPADVEGRLLHEVFSPEIAQRFRRHAQRAMDGGHPVRYDATRRMPGRSISVEVTISPIMVDRACTQLLVSIRDISDRVALERERARSERRLRKVMANAPHVLWQLDREGVVTSVTPAAQAVTGHPADELIGRTGTHLVHPGQVTAAHRLFDTVLRSPAGVAHRAEFESISRSGDPRWLDCIMSNLLDDRDIEAVVAISYDITERREMELQLAHQAHHDSLTGLANRRRGIELVEEMLRQADGEDRCAGLLFVDLDDFKRVNDTLGHDIGDRMLCEAASRLTEAVHNRALVARLGGDELIVIASKLGSRRDHLALADDVRRALDRPFEVGGACTRLTASIGVATATAAEGRVAEDLLRDADRAMYAAKRRAPGEVHVLDPHPHRTGQPATRA